MKEKKDDNEENMDYLFPKIEFNPNDEGKEDDYLLDALEERIGFVIECLDALKEAGAENTMAYMKYQTELYMMMALQNLHIELLQNEQDI